MAWRSRMSPSGQIANFGEGKVTPYGGMHIVNTKLKRANVSFSTLALYHWIRTQWRNKRKRKKKNEHMAADNTKTPCPCEAALRACGELCHIVEGSASSTLDSGLEFSSMRQCGLQTLMVVVLFTTLNRHQA